MNGVPLRVIEPETRFMEGFLSIGSKFIFGTYCTITHERVELDGYYYLIFNFMPRIHTQVNSGGVYVSKAKTGWQIAVPLENPSPRKDHLCGDPFGLSGHETMSLHDLGVSIARICIVESEFSPNDKDTILAICANLLDRLPEETADFFGSYKFNRFERELRFGEFDYATLDTKHVEALVAISLGILQKYPDIKIGIRQRTKLDMVASQLGFAKV